MKKIIILLTLGLSFISYLAFIKLHIEERIRTAKKIKKDGLTLTVLGK